MTTRPQCPNCGDPKLLARRANEPVVLASQPKRFTVDGGFRIMTPAETLARCEPRVVSPITGVLASLGPVPGRDHPSRPVQGAVYRVVPSTAAPGFDDFHKLSSGKGTTPTQARASALCEGLERISAIWHGDEVRRRATRADLGDDAITPPALQQFSAAQHRDRDERVTDPKRRVPRAYRDDDALDWTPVWSLSHARRRWLPTAYCYQHPPRVADLDLVGFNPNGHAAGNCVEEAVLQGFLELVERDAVAIWWYGRLRQPAVVLDDFAFAADLRAHYRELGWSVWVLELTTDLAIPTFVALAEREGGGRWSVGFGCHLDARLGVQRALTELNQIFDPDDSAPAPWDPAALGDLSFLRPDPDAGPRALADHAAITTDDLRADVLACVAGAAARGLEVLVLDQSRPDLGLSAVKVIVPGLRHFWPRLGPGRLYDVPVTLGRRATPLAEHELNPVPLYL